MTSVLHEVVEPMMAILKQYGREATIQNIKAIFQVCVYYESSDIQEGVKD